MRWRIKRISCKDFEFHGQSKIFQKKQAWQTDGVRDVRVKILYFWQFRLYFPDLRGWQIVTFWRSVLSNEDFLGKCITDGSAKTRINNLSNFCIFLLDWKWCTTFYIFCNCSLAVTATKLWNLVRSSQLENQILPLWLGESSQACWGAAVDQWEGAGGSRDLTKLVLTPAPAGKAFAVSGRIFQIEPPTSQGEVGLK